MMVLGYMGLKWEGLNADWASWISYFAACLILTLMPMTTTNSITHLSTNSWYGSPRGQNPDRWNIGRDGGTLQQVQVRMVEALKCISTFKRIVESPRDSRLSLSTTGPSYNIDD